MKSSASGFRSAYVETCFSLFIFYPLYLIVQSESRSAHGERNLQKRLYNTPYEVFVKKYEREILTNLKFLKPGVGGTRVRVYARYFTAGLYKYLRKTRRDTPIRAIRTTFFFPLLSWFLFQRVKLDWHIKFPDVCLSSCSKNEELKSSQLHCIMGAC